MSQAIPVMSAFSIRERSQSKLAGGLARILVYRD